MCDCGLYSREIINMFFVGQVSGLVETFNTGIYSDTLIMTNVKRCKTKLFFSIFVNCC